MTTNKNSPTPPASWRFKLLYDGECPICVRETRWLVARSKNGALAIEDISQPHFDASKYGVSQRDLMDVLHGVFPDGRLVNRVAALREAYRAAGLGWVFTPSEWPVVSWFYAIGYELFARYRIRIGTLFGRGCSNDTCDIKRLQAP